MRARMTLYRLQDADGLGPFSAPFSVPFAAASRARTCPEKQAALGAAADNAERHGLHTAFAAKGLCGLLRWFPPPAMRALLGAGFRVVDVSHLPVIAQDETQAVIAIRWPRGENQRNDHGARPAAVADVQHTYVAGDQDRP